MLAVVENIATAPAAQPQKSKELLRDVVESVLMTPAPGGCAIRVALKSISPATLEGNEAEDYEVGCGGRVTRAICTCNPSFRRRSGAS